MKISIITPTFNSETSIVHTLRSVLLQKDVSLEHILVDNVSQDTTLARAKALYAEFPTCAHRILSEHDRGIADAFNKGIRASSGDIIGILNSDDEYLDAFVLRRVMDAFQDPEVMIVHGNMRFIDEVHGSNIRRPLLCPITDAFPFNHPAFFVRRALYEGVGLFDETYRYCMDFEWVCRLYETPSRMAVKALYLDGDPLVAMRAGGASYSHEMNTIDEVERALKLHGFWNARARHKQATRRARIRLKRVVPTWMVRKWRRYKWASSS